MDRPLKSYAEKRRQDAGAPLELHPATRRMLQAEAARQAPDARGEASSWIRLLTGWLPRLAGAAVLCAFLGLIGWMLFQPDSLRREQNLARLSRDEVLLADNFQIEKTSPEDRPLTAPLDSLAPAAKPAPAPAIFAANEDSSAKAASLADGGAAPPKGSSAGVMQLAQAGSEKDTPARSVGLAGGAGGRELNRPVAAPAVNEARRFSLTTETVRRREEAAPAPEKMVLAASAAESLEKKAESGETAKSEAGRFAIAAAPAPASPAPTTAPAERPAPTPERRARAQDVAFDPTASMPAQNWSFQQLPAVAGSRTDARKKAEAVSVLTSFSWQQSGRQLRVVDADGSVYLGEAREPALVDPASASPAQLRFKQGAEDSLEKLALAERQTQAAGTFRVSGTNQTLRQRVVFSGQLLREPLPVAKRDFAMDNAQPALRPNALVRGAAPASTAAPAAALPVSAPQSAQTLLRIEAQATLGDGQVLPIRAISR